MNGSTASARGRGATAPRAASPATASPARFPTADDCRSTSVPTAIPPARSFTAGGLRRAATSAIGNRRAGRRRFLQATGAAGAAALAGCPLPGGGGGTTPTGDVTIGASIANAAELAARQTSDDGGLLGTDDSVEVEDTKEDPATGRTKYRELTVGANVAPTTGIFTGEVLPHVLDDVATRQTVHVTTGAATPKASARVDESYEDFEYHFRTGPIDGHHHGVNLVDFAGAKLNGLGWESVAVLVEDHEWTDPGRAVLDEQLGDTGIEVATTTRYAAGTRNVGPIHDDVESAGTIAADDVVAALEDSSDTGTAGTIECYGPDHQFVHDVVYDPENVSPVYQQCQVEDGRGVQEVPFPDDLATAAYATPPRV